MMINMLILLINMSVINRLARRVGLVI